MANNENGQDTNWWPGHGMQFATRAIHVGQDPDGASGAVIPPLSLSTTFAQRSPGHPVGGFDYSRSGNPTRASLETCLASLEEGRHGLAFSSGLAASVTLLHLLKNGDHIVCCDDVYGGTQRYFRTIASNFGLEFSFVDFTNPEAVRSAIVPEKTKMLWLESPTNPMMKIADISRITAIGREYQCLSVVDNTFCSPAAQRPLNHGADISYNSVSKYINGHSDVIMGFLATNDTELWKRLRYLQNSLGTIPSPFDCYLVLRGIKTLELRMAKHQENAMAIARFLEGHPQVERVWYPGLASHPQHDVASKQMVNYSGMLSFSIKGGIDAATRFLESIKIGTLAESLGGVETLVEHPAIMTHASVPVEIRRQLGIDDGLIRLSCGIENCEDLIQDLTQALDLCTHQ
uniref:cystathionine gamma-lyase n=1 Tax=Compsopogon caeruleus TaxID=31354 RepID=A0A7S1XFT9_9RHOD|mmetsp:Transcript_4933/g.9945  ORF Transcript_4933/g.9945 Transcript_4933/m.9945 type:complete len:403 (+) Transcript_4933:160-1368(+)|eukprot:CAMPEP_0184687980 /NCGR_PEP_ID=MMETSP0312-20130426/28134_1 /TAXON_ID=31354 /ORGANISM="Compsopogon coeruleus, Strain SAG 36.94" /LENGTH=402 /DNA_ID=CAMNT_0027144635 /DNA_START=154 /DNA_END=1362 /DNA_ORIENTATION=-